MVTSQDYPYLKVCLALRSYQTEVLAYIDTGFDGYLIMLVGLTQEIGKPDYISRWELGDGSLTQGQDYVGVVCIIGAGYVGLAAACCLARWEISQVVLN